MSHTSIKWLRVRISGFLEVKSPLHIGNGETTETVKIENANKKSQNKDKTTVLVDAVCKDSNGKPYLPATSLRGALRARRGDTALASKLFGKTREDSHLDTEAGMGKLRCYDAVADVEPISLSLRSGIKLDPLLGVVDTHKLYTREVVPCGSRFTLTVEVDQVVDKELAALLGLLESLGVQIAGGLGAGKSKDQGRLKWALERIDVIDAEALTEWAQNDDTSLPWKKLNSEISANQSLLLSSPVTVDFELEFHTPWIVDAPERRRVKSAIEPQPPDLEFSRTDDGHAWLPASTLKGWLRGRSRRILMTLLVGRGCTQTLAKAQVDALLKEIFGATDRAGWLIVSDAYSQRPAAAHHQQFVAINRFTGGSSDGALYDVNAASPCTVSGRLGWKSTVSASGDWRLGLFAMLARDAMEGDLVLGWGKGRGFGQGIARIHPPGEATGFDWPKLVQWLKDQPKAHLCALQNKLDGIHPEDSYA